MSRVTTDPVLTRSFTCANINPAPLPILPPTPATIPTGNVTTECFCAAGSGELADSSAGNHDHDHAECRHDADCNSPLERWVGECKSSRCHCASRFFLPLQPWSRTTPTEPPSSSFSSASSSSQAPSFQAQLSRPRTLAAPTPPLPPYKTRFCVLPGAPGAAPTSNDVSNAEAERHAEDDRTVNAHGGYPLDHVTPTPAAQRCLADAHCGPAGGGYCWLSSWERALLVRFEDGATTRWGAFACVCFAVVFALRGIARECLRSLASGLVGN